MGSEEWGVGSEGRGTAATREKKNGRSIAAPPVWDQVTMLVLGLGQSRASRIVRIAIHDAGMDLMIAALELAAVIDVRGADAEDCCSVGNARAVLNVDAIASRNGV